MLFPAPPWCGIQNNNLLCILSDWIDTRTHITVPGTTVHGSSEDENLFQRLLPTRVSIGSRRVDGLLFRLGFIQKQNLNIDYNPV